MSAVRSLASLAACTLVAGLCPWAMGALTGQWEGPYVLKPPGKDEATMAVHAILLPDGRVLCIDETRSPSPNSADIVVVDPDIPPPEGVQIALDEWDQGTHLLFCSGHAHLHDGKIFFLGGGTGCGLSSLIERRTTFCIPDPAGGRGRWLPGPDERWCPSSNRNCQPGQEVFTRRWYPTVTSLTGRMLGTDGQCDDPNLAVGEPNIPALLNLNAAQPELSSWLPLYDAGHPNGGMNDDLCFYPFMFLLSSGPRTACGAVRRPSCSSR